MIAGDGGSSIRLPSQKVKPMPKVLVAQRQRQRQELALESGGGGRYRRLEAIPILRTGITKEESDDSTTGEDYLKPS